MARRGKRDCDKDRFWRDMVQLWRRSPQTIGDFCAEQALLDPASIRGGGPSHSVAGESPHGAGC